MDANPPVETDDVETEVMETEKPEPDMPRELRLLYERISGGEKVSRAGFDLGIREVVVLLPETHPELETFFTYHPPTAEDVVRYQAINQAALAFAGVVLDHCPPSPDRTVAIRRIREARMDANASIACKGASLPR